MKFVVDAQLPRRLALFLSGVQHDAVHTLDLPHGNKTPDAELCEFCARERRSRHHHGDVRFQASTGADPRELMRLTNRLTIRSGGMRKRPAASFLGMRGENTVRYFAGGFFLLFAARARRSVFLRG